MENQTYSTKLLGVLHDLFQIFKSFLMIFTVSPREVKTTNCHCQIIVALVIQIPLTWILYTLTLFDCVMVFLHMHITCVSYREGRLHIFTFANITWSIALKLYPNVTPNRLGILYLCLTPNIVGHKIRKVPHNQPQHTTTNQNQNFNFQRTNW